MRAPASSLPTRPQTYRPCPPSSSSNNNRSNSMTMAHRPRHRAFRWHTRTRGLAPQSHSMMLIQTTLRMLPPLPEAGLSTLPHKTSIAPLVPSATTRLPWALPTSARVPSRTFPRCPERCSTNLQMPSPAPAATSPPGLFTPSTGAGGHRKELARVRWLWGATLRTVTTL